MSGPTRHVSLQAPVYARRGDPPTARDWNAFTNSILALADLGNRVKMARPRPWAEWMPHEIVAIFGDVLECVRVWGEVDRGTESVYVFRPPLLRASVASRDGVTYATVDPQTRTASKVGETDETQIVTPLYLLGDIISAVPIRGTVPLTTVPAIDNQRRGLVDANDDGRAYASLA